jgi:O-succinylbenzoic acid--CoA ligase
MNYKSEHFSSPNGNATAIISSNFYLSYGELAVQSLTVKNNLMERGLTSGERVALLGCNSPEYMILLYGLWQAGMVPVPLNTRWPVKMIEESLREIDSFHLIEVLPENRGIEIDSLNTIIGFELLENGGKVKDIAQNFNFDPNLDATILFTSGSSGKPKAALHTFRNHYSSAVGSSKNIPFGAEDCWLLSLPLYHIGGMAILFRALLGGGAVVVPSPVQTLDEILSEHQITHISLVVAQLKQLFGDQNNLPYLKRMKAMLLGGGPIPKNLVEIAAGEKLPLFCSYGSTEMSSQITTTINGDTIPQLQTAGSVLPYRELIIAEDSEIRVRGDTLFRGYIQGNIIDPSRDSNGWFHTGDLGEMDEQGYLTLIGRKDNMFISGGENIQPEEIEATMMQIEGISEVIVVPIDHPDYGKRPVAFIKIQEDKIQDTIGHGGRIRESKIQENEKKKDKRKKTKLTDDWVQEVREYLGIRLPKFMIPDHFFSWPEVDSEIKISRFRLGELARQRPIGKLNQ